jgi:type VI secretion system secreted protein VgrG
MEIDTPLGADVLLFHRMHAREELSRLPDIHLELLSDPTNAINFDEILGKNVTVKVLLQDESTRYFNGFVTRFASGGRLGRYLRYTATVSPWTWFMTRTTDCRIFQDKTVREIVEEVFADHPTADFTFELSESYDKLTYCVQYRETDFNFVSRLLEHEGIYYYFRHIDGGHTMVCTDSVDRQEPFPGYDEIRFIRPQELMRPDIEHISSWEFSREVQPGVFSLDDYDFERPAIDLRLSRPVPRKYQPSDYEWFDYPGLFTKKSRGEQLARVRGDEFGSQFERAVGVSNARGVSVGSIFKLDGFTREDQNVKHLVIGATHDLEYSDYEAMPTEGGSDFRCTFVAMTTAQQFRPQRVTPKPFVQGPQTAVVVGPAGDEIHTDEFGRVKVQFHWDSRGQKNEESSCWIRVSQPWAGKGWGSVATPRIGQEVVVDFLEGDPDQPLITGRVYNKDNQPPFGFPAGAVISGIKSKTHKGGGFNEISCDDTAGKEKVNIHAQHDMTTTVQNNQTITVVSGNRTMTIQSGTLTDTVKGDASLTVQAGSRTVDVTGGDYSATASDAILLHGKGAGVEILGDAKGVGITGNAEGVVIIGNGKGVGIEGNGEGVGIRGNGQGVGIEGNGEGVQITGNGAGVAIKGTPDFFAEGASSAAIKSPVVDIGDKEVNIVGTKITIAAGASSIVLDAGGVTIMGPLVKIN